MYESINPTKQGEECPNFQLQIVSPETAAPLRALTSANIGTLINVNGIIINSGKTTIRGKRVVARCRQCGDEKIYTLTYGFDGIELPYFCQKSKREG